MRLFVFFECKYFALILLAICHSKGRTQKNDKSKSDCFIWTDDEVAQLLKVCIERGRDDCRDWTRSCNVIGFESMRIRPSTGIQKCIGFKSFHSGERIQKFPDSQVGFTGCVWKKGVSGKKGLRIQKYPDTCGQGLILIEQKA